MMVVSRFPLYHVNRVIGFWEDGMQQRIFFYVSFIHAILGNGKPSCSRFLPYFLSRIESIARTSPKDVEENKYIYNEVLSLHVLT